jgi:uncharacterized membrane protein (DUF485 family)
MSERQRALEALARAQWRLALTLTAAMMAVYAGFILLVAYGKPLLGMLLMPGLSLGTLLGALVIVCAWLLIWIYVRWANGHYDRTVASLRGGPGPAPAGAGPSTPAPGAGGRGSRR